jgi:hypothetical protein
MIEYETITVKVPKLIMDFLRKTEEDPIKTIESNIVDDIRSQLEAWEAKEWIQFSGLRPVFVEVLGESSISGSGL